MKTNLISRKIIQKLMICVLLYTAGLAIGLFLIFWVQQHNHKDLQPIAVSVATEITQQKTYNILVPQEAVMSKEAVVSDRLGLANISVFFFKADTNSPIILYADHNVDTHQKLAEQWAKIFQPSHSFFYTTWILRPPTFSAIATEPVYIDNKFIGSVYATRIIHYLPSVIGAFVIFYSILYIVVLLYIRLQRKTNARIKDIYNKYIANISHELKTPIASIQAITSTLCEGLVEDDATQKQYYGIIDRESKRLEQSVLDIIALSKLQDHQVDVHKQLCAMSEILPGIQDRYGSFCDCVDMKFFIEDSMWMISDLYTNPDRIAQLMQILIDNAIKFSSEGDTISISATCTDKQATVCIADTGCGMDEETISHIFDRFYRGKNAETKPGSGLGLAIALELTNALNEKIRAESILGVGTKFFFTISRKNR